MTWYPQSFVETVPMTNMNMRPDPATGYPGRTYRFYKGETIYSFGDGLSYTQFVHHFIQAPPQKVPLLLEEGHVCKTSSNCMSIDVADSQICQNVGFEILMKVSNMGQMSGTHTVFMFSTPPSMHGSPQKQLLGFEKVYLQPEGIATVKFQIDVCKDLSVVDETGVRKVGLGRHVLHVGDLKHSFNVGV